MNILDFNLVPGVQPVDTAATALTTQFIDCKTAHQVAFIISAGVLTASSDDTVTITVTAATVQAGTSAVAIPFKYRLSGAVAANSLGALTAATSAGYAPLSSALTGNMVLAVVDVDSIPGAAESDARWINCVITPSAGNSVALLSAVALVAPRYKQATFVSTT